MATYDEYGCEIPEEHKGWLEKGAEFSSPKEDDPWYVTVAKLFSAPFTTVGGAIMDELPIIGGPVAGPLNDIAWAQRGQADQKRYEQCRSDAKERAMPRPNLCLPPPTWDEERQTYVDEGGEPISYSPHDGQY